MKLLGQVGCVTRTNWLDFGEDPDPTTGIFKVMLHHWEMGPKTMYRMISLKVVDELWQNEVDELVRWQEQADSILVQVRIQIRPISGKQYVNYSAWQRYVLYRVPFCFVKLSISEWFFICLSVCLSVCTELSRFSLQLLVRLRGKFHHWCDYLGRMF